MVLHMQLRIVMFEEQPEEKKRYYEQVFKSFDEVKEYAKAAGVRIALENMICTPQSIRMNSLICYLTDMIRISSVLHGIPGTHL